MAHELVCWKCGASLADVTLPLRRLEECPKCRAQLHVCRMCREYDVRVTGACREQGAEEVRNKEGANFCDFFRPRPDAHSGRSTAADQALSELNKLFGPR
jgi:hypothetical protein